MGCSNNGKLPTAVLREIPGGKLHKDAAPPWLDMRRDIIRRGGPAIRPGGPDSSYRPYSRQVYWKSYWCGQGACFKAATPGTSNHGCGKAVDEPYSRDQGYIRIVMHRFGWSDAEGRAVGESWHFVYVGGYHAKKADPLAGLTKRERGWVREYVRLKKAGKDKARRRVLRRYMRRQRKAIWRVAQKSGWHRAHRKKRYDILRRYSS